MYQWFFWRIFAASLICGSVFEGLWRESRRRRQPPLPCNATRLHPQFETAFAYVGAGASAPRARRSMRVFSAAIFTTITQPSSMLRASPRSRKSRDSFVVLPSTSILRGLRSRIALARKRLTENKRVEVVEARFEDPQAYGWPASGGGTDDGIVLKRMTTIGQNDATSALPKGMPLGAGGKPVPSSRGPSHKPTRRPKPGRSTTRIIHA